MSSPRNQTRSLGLKLLNLSAWVRRQGWLSVVYRRLPVALRNRVSEALASRVSQQTRFRRASNWERGAHAAAAAWTVTPHCGEPSAAAGVNVFAYARGQFGLAEAARLYTRALLAEGYPVAVYDIDLGLPHSMADTSLDPYVGVNTPYAVNLIFVNPDYLDAAVARIGPERLLGRYTIACWFWELEIFPKEWLPALTVVDEIIAASDFIAGAIESVTSKPVLRVPLPVEVVNDSGLTRADFGLDDDAFVFLASFDFNSFLARKNPLAVVDAFRQAFADSDANVQLLVKSSNGHRHPEKLRRLLNAVAGDSRILLRDEVIGRSDVQALQRCADAYVSLHRAEGFGLGIAESMLLGKPVIATAWSGNMDYMTADNSCLVDYRLVSVAAGEYLYPDDQRWAEPDISQAAKFMRRLVEDRAFATKIGEQASVDIRHTLSSHKAAEKIIQRLDWLALSSRASSVGTTLLTSTMQKKNIS